MEWWGWLIVVVGVLVILLGLFVGLQARRRHGGVIVGPTSGSGTTGSPGADDSGPGGAA